MTWFNILRLVSFDNANNGLIINGSGQIGISNFPFGQQLAADSLPVVLTAAQLTTLTPRSTVGITGLVNVAGVGAAGAPLGGVLTIQGDPAGTPIPVSGTLVLTNEDFNLAKVGGTNFSLGQQLGSASLPIVLTAAQLTTLTPPAAITNYALETGGNISIIAGSVSSSKMQTNISQVGGAGFALGQQLSSASLPIVLTAAQLSALVPLTTVSVTQGTSPWVVSGSLTPAGTQDVNLKQVGGSTFALGQQLAASSIPIVLTAAQITTLTPPAAITNYAIETGGNLATLAGGVISSKYQSNISQVGGSAFALGQQLAATSLPIVLTAAQITTLTPPTTVTVQQSTASNLNATVVGTGTFLVQAAQSGNWPVRIQDSSGSAITLGQQLAAASLPVVLTAAQISTLTPLSTVTANQGAANATPWNENISQYGGVATSLGQKVSASSIPMVIASDQSPIGTTSAQATRVTGTIISSIGAVSAVVSQYSVATVTFSGTYAGVTINFEASDDGGTTYYPVLGSLSSSTANSVTSATLVNNSSVMYNVTLPGVTNFRVRASAYTSGTLNVGITATADPMVFNVAAGIIGIPTIQGNAANLSSDTGSPVKTGGVFNTTQPTATNGQRIDSQSTARGGLIVATGVDNFNVNLTQVGSTSFALGQQLAAASLPVVLTAAQITTLTPLPSVTVTQSTASSLNAQVTGTTATGATFPTNAVGIGIRAQNAEATAVTNGQLVAPAGDLAGKTITMPFANKENVVTGTATTTGTSDTSVIAAQGASVKFYMTEYTIWNSGTTAVKITFKNGSAGATLWTDGVPAGGRIAFTLPTPVATSANTALFFAADGSSSTVNLSVGGYKGA